MASVSAVSSFCLFLAPALLAEVVACGLLVIAAIFVIHFGSSIFEFVPRLGVACLLWAGSEDFGSHHFVSPIAISPLPRPLALGALELVSLVISATYT